MRFSGILVVLAVVALGGCASSRPSPQQLPFVSATHAGTCSHIAFAVTPDGHAQLTQTPLCSTPQVVAIAAFQVPPAFVQRIVAALTEADFDSLPSSIPPSGDSPNEASYRITHWAGGQEHEVSGWALQYPKYPAETDRFKRVWSTLRPFVPE